MEAPPVLGSVNHLGKKKRVQDGFGKKRMGRRDFLRSTAARLGEFLYIGGDLRDSSAKPGEDRERKSPTFTPGKERTKD